MAINNSLLEVRDFRPFAPQQYYNHYGPTFYGSKTYTTRDVLVPLRGYTFLPFYHPYVDLLLETLNVKGFEGIFDLLEKSDDGAVFERYRPNTAQAPHALVQEPFPKEEFSFEVKSAYGQENWFTFYHIIVLLVETLMENNKHEDAIRWIEKCLYNPKTVQQDGSCWKLPLFKNNVAQSTATYFENIGSDDLQSLIGELNQNPFNPFLVAYYRPQEFMMYVVSLYVRAHIAIGDNNFRMIYNGGGMDFMNIALEYYKIAKRQLGERPQSIPNMFEKKPETYESLRTKGLNPAANALVQYENIFPFGSDASLDLAEAQSGTFLGGGYTFYFQIPPDKNVLALHDLIQDRTAKLRSCRDIDGIERKIDLFGTPLNPNALLGGLGKGLSLGQILGGLYSPPPQYRFGFLIQKAVDACNDFRSIASAVIGVVEKRDNEQLALIRARHERVMLDALTSIKERQFLESQLQKQSVMKTRETTRFRLEHYKKLLGISSDTPSYTDMPTDLTAESQLPVDTIVSDATIDVDVSLVDASMRGIKLIPKEKGEIDKLEAASKNRGRASSMERIAAVIRMYPDFSTQAQPMGVGGTVTYGSSNIAAYFSAIARDFQSLGDVQTHDSNMAAKYAGYMRREQEWVLQHDLAAREITQIDKQLAAADIRIQIAEKELENHRLQVEHSTEVEDFLINKESNLVSYQRAVARLKPLAKNFYDLALFYARSAEQSYKFEMPTKEIDFIRYDFEDSLSSCATAGEKLLLSLKEMEKSYLQHTVRKDSVKKRISLNRLNPLEFLRLRKEGKAEFQIPEWLLLLDNRSIYNAKWVTMNFSTIMMVGVNTNLNIKVRLHENFVRISTATEEGFAPVNGEDKRFIRANTPFDSITISSAQDDNGLNVDALPNSFYQNQYMPFENTGFISTIEIDLHSREDDGTDFSQVDWNTLADIVINGIVSFDEDEGDYKVSATEYLNELLAQPRQRTMMYEVKRDFSNEHYAFTSNATDRLKVQLTRDHFPYLDQLRDITINAFGVVTPDEQENIQLVMGGGNIAAKHEDNPFGDHHIYMTEDDLGIAFEANIDLQIPLDKPASQDSYLLVKYFIA